MNKQFKFFLTSAAIAAALVGAVSCQKDYSGDINDLNSKISALSSQLQTLQDNIKSGEIVTNVEKIANGIKVTTSKGSYEIVNGKDGVNGTNGTNGTNGKDGSVVTIGENGNWFIDGVDQNIPAAGKNGTNGTNGIDGKNGEYYVPNAETGKFDKYTWDAEKGEYVKTATDIAFLAPGTITAVYDPEAGTLTLIGVDGFDGPYVLSLDGKLKSLVFLPQVYIDGVEGMMFSNFAFVPKDLEKADSADEKQIDKKDAKPVNVNPAIIAQYHVNPANADLSFLVEGESTGLSFIKQANVKKVETRAKASDDFDATPIFKSFKDGILTVEVQVTGVPATEDLLSVIALNVELEDGEFVTSDYATLQKEDLSQLGIAFPNAYAKEKLEVEDAHYRRASEGISKTDANAYIADYAAWTTGEEALEDAEATCDVAVKFTESLDLNKLVAAHKVTEDGTDAEVKPVELTAADLEALGLSWEFAVVKNYKIGQEGSETDQIHFVDLKDGIFTPKVYETEGEAAIGRTPIVRVALKHGDDVVEYAYIKVYISDKDPEQTEPYDVTYSFDPDSFGFACEGGELELLTTVKYMNVYIYNALKMSKDLFHATYDTFVPNYEVPNATEETAIKNVGTVEEVENAQVEGTHILKWTITADEAWEYAGKKVQHLVAYQSSNNPKIIAVILLEAEVDGIQKSYNVEKAQYISNYWNAEKTATRYNVAVPTFVGDEDPENCVFVNDINASFVTWPAGSEEGVPGVLKLNPAVTEIQYFFCATTGHDIKAPKIDGKDVVFTISEDGLTLSAKVAGGEEEVIATIDNEGEELPNTITLNKESDLAKKLLNTKQLYVNLGAKGIVCGDETKEVAITFDGKDHFRADYVRPIDIADTAADKYIDAVDYGEEGSYIRIEDLIAPYDWRGRYFSEYENYWGFYGPFEITVDLENVKCDLNNEIQPIPKTVILETKTFDEMKELVGEEKAKDLKETDYGYVTYKNNGTGVSDFNIFLNVTVKYGWGEIMKEGIKVPVAATIEQ